MNWQDKDRGQRRLGTRLGVRWGTLRLVRPVGALVQQVASEVRGPAGRE